MSTCTETYTGTPDQVQQTCLQQSIAGGPTVSYSQEHCPTVGLTGKCTASNGGSVRLVIYYYNMSSIVSSVKTGCTDTGGTWGAY